MEKVIYNTQSYKNVKKVFCPTESVINELYKITKFKTNGNSPELQFHLLDYYYFFCPNLLSCHEIWEFSLSIPSLKNFDSYKI